MERGAVSMSDQIPPQQPPFTEIPSSGPSYPPPAPASSSGLSDNAAGALAYVTIIPAIVFLILEPYNKIPFVKFHSFQSLGLSVVWFALYIVMMILQFALHAIPLIGILFFFLHLAIFLGLFIAWLMCIIKASQGAWFKLPIIGAFAEQQARR
jgi:uncharacterized membrane protein